MTLFFVLIVAVFFINYCR